MYSFYIFLYFFNLNFIPILADSLGALMTTKSIVHEFQLGSKTLFVIAFPKSPYCITLLNDNS